MVVDIAARAQRKGRTSQTPSRFGNAREKVCTILSVDSRGANFVKKHFLLLRKISHCYISKLVEPPEYHWLS